MITIKRLEKGKEIVKRLPLLKKIRFRWLDIQIMIYSQDLPID